MTTEQKQVIATEVVRLAKLYGKKDKTSASKVAVKAGVSSATISHITQGKWDGIADEMWRKIKVKLRINFDWKTADTANVNYIKKKLDYAKENGKSIGFAHDAGTGKSHTFRMYENNIKNVIYLECMRYWTPRSYTKAFALACGLDDAGNTVENIENIVNHIAELDKPLIIIDQMDKLKDGSMSLFVDLYNHFDENCGFVLSGVPALSKMIKAGVKNDKFGCREIWSRIGRKFLSLKPLTLKDVTAICNANDYYDEENIQTIFNTCDGDLRNVKKDVQLYLLIQKETAA